MIAATYIHTCTHKKSESSESEWRRSCCTVKEKKVSSIAIVLASTLASIIKLPTFSPTFFLSTFLYYVIW